MTEFTKFNLTPALLETLTNIGYVTPTPIQDQAIPPAMEGRDILGSAQTGTGKTAAFGLPLITKLQTSHRGSALILTPTRELASQVMDVLKKMLGKYNTIQTALLIGGESMGPQFTQLRNRPRLIVGTPGRVFDHLERGTLMLHDAGFLVLDETDRMLDMGFSIQLEKILKFLPKVRQTLLFSATMPSNIMQLSQKYLTNPVRIEVGSNVATAENIDLSYEHVDSDKKYTRLTEELQKREGTIIVFVKTKRGAERLSFKLARQKFSAEAIHGDLKQSQRDRVIEGFREKKYRILVATDIAARGLDIPHIEHVINFDLPQAPEDYIHRIGRTARAGAQGFAISFISPEDMIKWREIQRMLNPKAAGASAQHEQREPKPHRGQGGNGGGDKSKRRRPFFKRKQGGGEQRASA